MDTIIGSILFNPFMNGLGNGPECTLSDLKMIQNKEWLIYQPFRGASVGWRNRSIAISQSSTTGDTKACTWVGKNSQHRYMVGADGLEADLQRRIWGIWGTSWP